MVKRCLWIMILLSVNKFNFVVGLHNTHACILTFYCSNDFHGLVTIESKQEYIPCQNYRLIVPSYSTVIHGTQDTYIYIYLRV